MAREVVKKKVKLGAKSGVQKRDPHLYDAVKGYGLNLSHITYLMFGSEEKKWKVKLYQMLYNFQEVSDKDLESLRGCVQLLLNDIQKKLDESKKLADRKRKLKLYLDTKDEDKFAEMLKKLEEE